MSQHGNREQKRLAKKKAKRASKRMHVARGPDVWKETALRSAADWPILEALVPVSLWTDGIGALVIARQMPDGRIAFANFLVDTYCLGVKNAFCEVASLIEYRTMKGKLEQTARMKRAAPELFAKLVFESIQYARGVGFEPHPDFHPANLLLAGIDSAACTDQFEFGKDGQPLYIQGPNDSPGRAFAISARVQAAGGHFVMVRGNPLGDFEPELLDDEDEDEEEAGIER